ncbi:MAG: cytochrome c nitrite reductase small subunit [Deltaproteobacteria bacterium]|nr:cytochrome c nitrite reductase small subunit [Deltaproteobacteria bacterium]
MPEPTGVTARAPSRRAVIAILGLGVTLGLAVGLGGFTFVYAKGASYLGSDPAACANCHVMQAHFDAWVKGSHRSVAGCNDCHAPHTFFGKYATKARNGFWHSFYFTTGKFHEPIQIGQANHEVTEGACRSCHADVVHAIDPFLPLRGPFVPLRGAVPKKGAEMSCVRCHRDVGHPL